MFLHFCGKVLSTSTASVLHKWKQ